MRRQLRPAAQSCQFPCPYKGALRRWQGNRHHCLSVIDGLWLSVSWQGGVPPCQSIGFGSLTHRAGGPLRASSYMLATPWSCVTLPVVPLWQRATSPLVSLPAPQTRRQRCSPAWYCSLAGKTLPASKTTWRGIDRHQHHVRQAVHASCFAKMAA